MKTFFNKYKRFIAIISCIFIAIILSILLLCSLFEPEFIIEENFSKKDSKIISDLLHINCQNKNVKKATFSHARESVFYFYFSDIKKEDIDENYYDINQLSFENSNQIIYNSSKNRKIYCILDTETQNVEIRLEKYDDKLYKILKY